MNTSMEEECMQVWKRSVNKYGRGMYRRVVCTSMEEESIKVWKRNV